MAFQKSEYKEQYEEQESELAYELDRPLYARNYLDEDEKLDKATKVYFKKSIYYLWNINYLLK